MELWEKKEVHFSTLLHNAKLFSYGEIQFQREILSAARLSIKYKDGVRIKWRLKGNVSFQYSTIDTRDWTEKDWDTKIQGSADPTKERREGNVLDDDTHSSTASYREEPKACAISPGGLRQNWPSNRRVWQRGNMSF